MNPTPTMLNESVAVMHPPRVHFNPSTEPRYRPRNDPHHHHEAAEPTTITSSSSFKGGIRIKDKNRNKNDMKNGTRSESSFPIHNQSGGGQEEEKVQKVLVTIVSVASSSSTANTPITPTHNNNSSNHDRHQECQRNIPDLLKTTPLFYRKQFYQEEKVSEAGNPLSVPFLDEDAERVGNKSAILPSELNCGNSSSRTLITDHPNNTCSSSKSSLFTGLVQQLRRLVSKNKTSGSSGGGSHPSNKSPTVTEEQQQIPIRFFGVQKNHQNNNGAENSNVFLTGTPPPPRLHSPTRTESFFENETCLLEKAENFGPPCPIFNREHQQKSFISGDGKGRQLKETTTKSNANYPEIIVRTKKPSSSSSSFHYKTAMDSLHGKNATDELSANVDKILEEIAGLEDLIMNKEECDSSIETKTTPTPKKIKDDDNDNVIAQLVNECCTMSSALSSLTESANSLSSMTTCPMTKGHPAESWVPVHGLIRKPPLPPTHRMKYLIDLNSDLRNQFFQPPLFQKKNKEEESSTVVVTLSNPVNRQQQQPQPRSIITVPLKASHHKLSHALDSKLSEVKEELYRSREEMSRLFHPNLKEIDRTVRSSMDMIDRFGRNQPPNTKKTSSGWESSSSSTCSLAHSEKNSTNDHHQHHSKYEKENLDKQFDWNAIVTRAKEKLVVSPRSNSNNSNNSFSSSSSSNVGNFTNCPRNKCWKKGILETDLDTGASQEIFKTNDPSSFCKSSETSCTPNSARVVKSRRHSQSRPLSKLDQKNTSISMQNLNLGSNKSATLTPAGTTSGSKEKEDRSRSMEFLLDDEKHAELMPPENALQKSHETRQASEHELRIQRSLQRLNVPDWYKNYATPTNTPGTTPTTSKTTKKEFGSGLAGGWSGLSSSSLQSVGRYAGSKTGFSSTRPRGTTPTGGGRSSRESLMSPSSTASASPSPYFERSSFTYGMPYALNRFSTRMSCGASPSSLSPSPSPVGGITSSTSTPVSSGPMSRYGYNKTPYLGWRSQERLNTKTLYRSPSERLAADLMSHQQKPKPPPSTPVSTTGSNVSIVTSPRKETSSDLSLNISDTSESSNKLNRVRSSIKEVSNAIIDYVNETKPLDEGMNGRASPNPRRGLIWLESSFVGTKPIDSPGTPDTTTSAAIMSKHLGAHGSAYLHTKRSAMKLMDHNGDRNKDTGKSSQQDSQQQAFSTTTTYLSRNEKTGEQSNSSSLSSPTLDDILDSLLALRRPQKKIRGKGHNKADESSTTPNPQEPFKPYDIPASDWQQRMNQPLDDTMYFPQDSDSYLPTTTNTNNPAVSLTTTTITKTTIGSNNNAAAAPDNNEMMMTSSYFDTLKESVGATTTSGDGGGTNSGFDYGANLPPTKKSPWMDNQKNEEEDDENFGRIAQEESNFGTPTEILPSSMLPPTTHITNPLAGLNENNSTSSNPSTPARLRRVSFDLDTSDKDEKSSSRSKKDVDSVGGSIQCKNLKCGKTASGLEARREFKTCHNCNAYYCSRDCRRMHWEKHKKVCMQSRVGQLCKQIITHVKDDSFVVSQLSTVAKRGFLAKGRGCVKLFFSSPDRAERFLTGGLPELPEPWYIPHSEMLPEEMGAPTFSELSDSCRTYNSETRFVLYVSVCVVNEVPTSGAVKWEREMISRCSKIRLLIPRSFDESQPHHHAAIPSHLNPDEVNSSRAFSPTHHLGNYSDELLGGTILPAGVGGGENETLILRSVPTPASLKLNSSDDRRRREVSFTNIQKHLIERGVELRRTYPDIYSKLCNYVENDEPFLPVTIYPRNSQTGSQFMCVIMPESSDTSYELSSDPSSKVETINISE